MAKAKVWVIRYAPKFKWAHPSYVIATVKRKPYRRNGKWIGLGKAGLGNYPHIMERVTYERIFAKQYHLPPGGGPVEIRFAVEA
jgi:hypothetical protein